MYMNYDNHGRSFESQVEYRIQDIPGIRIASDYEDRYAGFDVAINGVKFDFTIGLDKRFVSKEIKVKNTNIVLSLRYANGRKQFFTPVVVIHAVTNSNVVGYTDAAVRMNLTVDFCKKLANNQVIELENGERANNTKELFNLLNNLCAAPEQMGNMPILYPSSYSSEDGEKYFQ